MYSLSLLGVIGISVSLFWGGRYICFCTGQVLPSILPVYWGFLASFYLCLINISLAYQKKKKKLVSRVAKMKTTKRMSLCCSVEPLRSIITRIYSVVELE